MEIKQTGGAVDLYLYLYIYEYRKCAVAQHYYANEYTNIEHE
jgi:hypothetical protein